jgi:hypothetical protein
MLVHIVNSTIVAMLKNCKRYCAKLEQLDITQIIRSKCTAKDAATAATMTRAVHEGISDSKPKESNRRNRQRQASGAVNTSQVHNLDKI